MKQKKGNKKALTQETGVKVSITFYLFLLLHQQHGILYYDRVANSGQSLLVSVKRLQCRHSLQSEYAASCMIRKMKQWGINLPHVPAAVSLAKLHLLYFYRPGIMCLSQVLHSQFGNGNGSGEAAIDNHSNASLARAASAIK